MALGGDGLLQIGIGWCPRARLGEEDGWNLVRCRVTLRLPRAGVARSGSSKVGHGQLSAGLVFRDGGEMFRVDQSVQGEWLGIHRGGERNP